MRILIGADTDVNGASYIAPRLAAGLARRGHDIPVAGSTPAWHSRYGLPDSTDVTTGHNTASSRGQPFWQRREPVVPDRQRRTAMPATPPLTTAAKIQVVGLIAGPVGIGIQIATGVDSFPLIPPGAVLMLAGAIVVALVPWRWTPVVGLLAAAWIGVGALVTPEAGQRLSTPSDIGPFVGMTVQLAGVIVAVLAGVIAVLHAVRIPQKAAAQP